MTNKAKITLGILSAIFIVGLVWSYVAIKNRVTKNDSSQTTANTSPTDSSTDTKGTSPSSSGSSTAVTAPTAASPTATAKPVVKITTYKIVTTTEDISDISVAAETGTATASAGVNADGSTYATAEAN